jgi:acetylornithine deacetylase/succinyl-diaminopimelate desuccinylase-like protein
MTDKEALAKIDAYIEEHVESFIDRLRQLVNQPSVAAQNLGIEECAALVAGMLREQGHHVEVMPTGGSPAVYAESKGRVDNTLIFYQHYDVQPAEPFELWESPPFELTRRGDALYGRGVSDNKGNIIARIAAIEAIQHVMGELPCNIKFLIEGEEETGSVSLVPFVKQHRKKLAADACIWEFGGVNFQGRPELVLGLRGICYVTLAVRTASTDAHSGKGGSIFPNAAWRLVWALNTLKGQDERILIPGFYDDVRPPTERDLALLAALPDDTQDVKERYGIKGFLNDMTDPAEIHRTEVFQPTCTICGLTSGYQGPGSKTVLPAEASAKIDFRLVPDQMPDDIIAKLRAHLDAHGFDDITITDMGSEPAAKTDPDDPFIRLVAEAGEEVYGVPPAIHPIIGGSGPNYVFAQELNVPIGTVGVGHPGSRAHAPNENIRIKDFILGITHTAHVITRLGEMG